MGYCLSPQLAEKFKKALKSGEVNPDKLNQMSSKERNKFFTKLVGKEDAPNVNALFESKLLLKNQKKGMLTWAKTVSGIKEPTKRDIFTTIERLDKVLDPEGQKNFLNDLANKRLGVDVSMKESKNIYNLSKNIDEAKSGLNSDGVSFKSVKAKNKYGLAKDNLNEYIKTLKESAMKLTKEDLKKNPLGTSVRAVSETAGAFKSMVSMADNSGLLRQGWKTLMTNPSIWRKNAIKSFKDIWNSFGGKDTLAVVRAEGFSRENALNGFYRKMKLAVGVTEEAYPSAIPSKIPYYRRIYKASENAYAGFLYRQRMDVADKYIKIAKETGVELSDKELGNIGNMVNALTGRGSFGKFEGEATNLVNNVFFSPRLLKSHVDTLGGHIITGGGGISGGSNFVRKQSAINLLKIIGGTAGVLMVAKTLNPKSFESDSRSTDFGKIKVGNTRFDVTGGMGSVVVLASRLIRNASKSSTTGRIAELDSGKFGATTKRDVIMNFAENKLSPASALVNHLLIKGTDFRGKKPTVMGELGSLTVPLTAQNIPETLGDPKSANLLLVLIADGLGIATTTYSKKDFKKKNKKERTLKETIY